MQRYSCWALFALSLCSGTIAAGSASWAGEVTSSSTSRQARDEAVRSREVLERRLGLRITSLAYPYGTRADFSHTTGNVLAETGYTTAMTSQHGAITRDADPIELPRIKVEGGEGQWMFRLLCRGGLDGWRLVDRTLCRVQQADAVAPPKLA